MAPSHRTPPPPKQIDPLYHSFGHDCPLLPGPHPSLPLPLRRSPRSAPKQLSAVNVFTLLVLDSCHFSIHRGSIYWSPGYGIMLMASARVAMIAFMADLWVVGYSIALVVYGGALVREVR